MKRECSPAAPSFLLAVESGRVVNEIRRLLDSLLGGPACEVLPPDGPTVLGRLRSVRPKLAFLSMRMRRMEGLTVLRALPPGRARSVVFLAPDTLEGYRAAWEALYLGARDILVTRGTPAQRFKGNVGQRLRRLAYLLSTEGAEVGWPDPWLGHTVPPRNDGAPGPWILLAETRALVGAGEWMRTLRPDVPVVMRVPEGPRFLRVVREGLSRRLDWPVRVLIHGDRLVPGHVHLFSDSEVMGLVGGPGQPRVELKPAESAPGSWPAHQEALDMLRRSPFPLRLVVSDLEDPELESRLLAAGHIVHRLETGPVAAGEPRQEAA